MKKSSSVPRSVHSHTKRLGIANCDIVQVESPKVPIGAFDRAGAARYLSISTRLLDDLLSAGTIKKIKIGRKTLVRLCDLDAYLAGLAEEDV